MPHTFEEFEVTSRTITKGPRGLPQSGPLVERTSAPSVEPVTLSELKDFARITLPEDDAIITQLIASAREKLEDILGMGFVKQTIRQVFQATPVGLGFKLNRRPLHPTPNLSIKVFDEDDTETAVATTVYGFTKGSDTRPAQIFLKSGQAWPVRSLPRPFEYFQVTYDVGFGDDADSIPESIKVALLRIVSSWYEHREQWRASDISGVTGRDGLELPANVFDTLGKYRKFFAVK